MAKKKKTVKQVRRKNQEKTIQDVAQEVKTQRDKLLSEYPQALEPQRASEYSYIFTLGNKTPIRNLSDEFLNNEYERIQLRQTELSRELRTLETVTFNMSMEQRFRGLK